MGARIKRTEIGNIEKHNLVIEWRLEKMEDRRDLVISRKYEKGSETRSLFVADVSGGDIAGSVFRFESWLNNVEQTDERVTSGNQYKVRRAFIGKLLDLHEDGWLKRGAGTYGHERLSFFDPSEL
jgi:hypothetical protein